MNVISLLCKICVSLVSWQMSGRFLFERFPTKKIMLMRTRHSNRSIPMILQFQVWSAISFNGSVYVSRRNPSVSCGMKYRQKKVSLESVWFEVNYVYYHNRNNAIKMTKLWVGWWWCAGENQPTHQTPTHPTKSCREHCSSFQIFFLFLKIQVE